MKIPNSRSYLPPTPRAYMRHGTVRLLSILGIGRVLTVLFKVAQKRRDVDSSKSVLVSSSNTVDQATKIVVFAHYASRPEISKSDLFLISQFRTAGYAVVVSTTCTSDETEHRMLWRDLQEQADGLITRANFGFDFASWSTAIDAFISPRADVEQLLLVNNSVYGPFAPLLPLIEELSRDVDIFGLTASIEFSPHVQSYFLGFNHDVLQSSEFRNYWSKGSGSTSKWVTIFRKELAWAKYFVDHGYVSAVLIDETRHFPRNPLTFMWKELLEEGFPFIKKSLLSHNYDSVDTSGWLSFISHQFPDFEVSLVVEDIQEFHRQRNDVSHKE